MVITKSRDLTFEEFLEYDANDDRVYELEDGEPIAMAEPSWKHEAIAKFLERRYDNEIERLELPYDTGRLILVKVGTKRGRRPDVVVFPDHYVLDESAQSALSLPPLLVVEIVSTQNWKQDYTAKKTYYLGCGIPEYWIIDPIPRGTSDFLEQPGVPTVSIAVMGNGKYTVKQYRGSDVIESPLFHDLKLTADQIINAKRRG
jgi:Uma2 family endonuclease